MKLPFKYLVLLTCLISIFFSLQLKAQKKVKYKNIYPLLQSRDFDNASKDLLLFLSENNDEANAYFYLGELLSLQLATTEIFPETSKYDSLADAAVDAYKKSIALIDEKEVRKNDEYYMAYNRRDLRTGKFGIKVSDVHLDYENKISALEEKKLLVTDIHQLQKETSGSYGKLAQHIKLMVGKYPDKESFLWRMSTDNLGVFEETFSLFDTFGTAIKSYREKLDQLNHPLYKIELFTKQVEHWEELYVPALDLSVPTVIFLDYKSYFESLKSLYDSEISPLKSLVLATDNKLNQAITINKEVTDSTGTLQVVLDKSLTEGLKKHLSSELLSSILSYKLTKSELSTLKNPSLTPVLNDTLNFYLRAGVIASILRKQMLLSERLTEIEKFRDEKSEMDISFYLAQFSPSFNEWMTFEKTISDKLIETTRIQNDSLQEKIKYIFYEADTLYMPGYSAQHPLKSIDHVIASDSALICSGVYGSSTFIANASFNMVLNHITLLDSTSQVSEMLPLQGQYILNAVADDSLSFKNKIVYFNEKTAPIWQFAHDLEDRLSSVKMEAGILFIYNEQDEIFLTLNKAGKQIGD